MDDAFTTAVTAVCHPNPGSSLKVVYTPLHGAGNKPVRRVLAQLGYQDVVIVPEQELPDGNFTTAPYPNPEDRSVFTLAMALAGALLLGASAALLARTARQPESWGAR